MATTLETPLLAKTISPGLTVDDIQQSIRFFEGLALPSQIGGRRTARCSA